MEKSFKLYLPCPQQSVGSSIGGLKCKEKNLRLTLFNVLDMNTQWLNHKIERQKLIRERMKKSNQVKILRETKQEARSEPFFKLLKRWNILIIDNVI